MADALVKLLVIAHTEEGQHEMAIIVLLLVNLVPVFVGSWWSKS
jgi:hypothetical protein